jgi:hypothetical protein
MVIKRFQGQGVVPFEIYIRHAESGRVGVQHHGFGMLVKVNRGGEPYVFRAFVPPAQR